MSLQKVIQEATYQGIGGFVIGTVVDSLFPPAEEIHDGNFVKQAAETLFQLGAVGFGSALFFDFLFKRGIKSDDTKYIPFVFSLLASQNSLLTKLKGLSLYSSAKITNWLNMPDPISQKPTNGNNIHAAGYMSLNTDVNNPEVPAGSEE